MSANQRIRKLRGLTSLKDFAEKLGVTSGAVSNIESGGKNLSIKMAKKISALYNVSVDWLYNGDTEPKVSEIPNEGLKEPLVDYELMSKYIHVLEENSRLKDQLLDKQKRQNEKTKNIKDISNLA